MATDHHHESAVVERVAARLLSRSVAGRVRIGALFEDRFGDLGCVRAWRPLAGIVEGSVDGLDERRRHDDAFVNLDLGTVASVFVVTVHEVAVTGDMHVATSALNE